ncbi:MAG: efflux RND transporter periplasmic adaptor subunit [Terriglobia bacterium]
MQVKKPTEWLVAGMLAVALAGAGCGGQSEAEADKTTTASQAAAPAQPSGESAPATPEESGQTLEILSVLSVEQEVDLLARRDGIVVEIARDQGSRVQKGMVLARLDDQDLLAQLNRARADLHVARSNVKYNEAEVRARQAAYRRAQEMHELGLNSDADLEEAEFKAKGAEYDLESWRAVVDRTQAEIHLLELELEKTRIHAPFSGVVARRYIRFGQNVLKDQKCFRLTQLAPLQVRFLVPEAAARRPRVGDWLEVVALGNSQRVYRARIRKVSPVVDPASGGIEVMAELTHADLEVLRPGMGVHVLWSLSPRSAP